MVLPGGILIASLLGSTHCVAMCGGLVVNLAQGNKALILYHFGRLLSYMILGALAGALGGFLVGNSVTAAMSWATSLIFAAILIAAGIRRFQGRSLHFKLPLSLSTLFARALGFAQRKKIAWLSPFALGFLSAFLPCGGLYTFVVTASATKSATLGAASLSLFWLGTVPALSAIPSFLNRASSKLQLNTPKLSGAMLVALGLFSLSLHAAPLFSPSSQAMAPPCPLHKH
jgi:sulfite exporter TauE/SafE